MAKRHPSLVPLSQDHHHGLALALRLQQGSNALLNDGWTHDRVEQAQRVRDFYAHDLRPHFQAEEEIVFPAVRSNVPDAVSLIDELIRQHHEMGRLIGSLDVIDKIRLERNLVELGELLERHIRSEERELFELMQQQLPSTLLDEMEESVKRIVRGE